METFSMRTQRSRVTTMPSQNGTPTKRDLRAEAVPSQPRQLATISNYCIGLDHVTTIQFQFDMNYQNKFCCCRTN